MADNDDDIPVLTETIPPGDARGEVPIADLDRLEAQICASSLTAAEEMLRDACQEAEHLVVQRVMAHLRAELPSIVRGVLREHLER